MSGILKNIYPWGMMSEHAQPVYDIEEETLKKMIRYVKETEITGILR
jgi:hypothetical protein